MECGENLALDVNELLEINRHFMQKGFEFKSNFLFALVIYCDKLKINQFLQIYYYFITLRT